MSKHTADDEDDVGTIPLVRYTMPTDPAELAALTGFLILPRIRGIKYAVDGFKAKCEGIDLAHGTEFAKLVERPSDEEAFKRVVATFGTSQARLEQVKLPAKDLRIKYSWCQREQNGEDVSSLARAWIEFRRAAVGSTSGTVHYSTDVDGCPLPAEAQADFASRFLGHRLTMNTADMRVFVAEVMQRLGAKNLGKNIWFAPVGANLAAFAAVVDAINTAAGYSAVVLFEIAKTGHNATMGKTIVAEMFKTEMDDLATSLGEYEADLAAYEADPKGNKMRYRSRARKGLAELQAMQENVGLYAELLQDQADVAVKKVEAMRAKWRNLFNHALIAAEEYDEALVFNSDNKRPYVGPTESFEDD